MLLKPQKFFLVVHRFTQHLNILDFVIKYRKIVLNMFYTYLFLLFRVISIFCTATYNVSPLLTLLVMGLL